jgi:ABC-type lipoprotein export system ATPase subunit
VVELLMGFCRHENTILLMSTHDPAVMAAADQTVSLMDGRIDNTPPGNR